MTDTLGPSETKYGDRFAKWQNLPQMFFEKAAELGSKPFFHVKRDGAWQAISWDEAADQVGKLSRGLRALGVEPGDRVVLVSENRPEWCIADLAIMTAGALTVPAYTTNTVTDHVHIMSDSGAKIVLVSTAKLADPVIAAARAVDEVRDVVCMETPRAHAAEEDAQIRDWDAVMAMGADLPNDVAEKVAAAKRTETCCIIYTSGTGGLPKGVMLSHGAILCNVMGAFHLLFESGLGEIDKETFLSFLPLSHSYEHMAGLYFPISTGSEIYFAESIDKLVGNMAEARPTIMTAVPRLYETMHARIVSGVAQAGGFKAKLFNRAVELGIKSYEQGPESLTLVERLTNRLLDRLVRRKVAQRFGGRLKAFVSGGAPLNYEIGVFFVALGQRLLQGYGQTETAPLVSCNPVLHNRIRTVGKPVKGVTVKILDDGEIIVSGELVMQGYWRDPQATAGALKDGWVHTGDIGEIDNEGYLRITDRKKDLIVNSGGDNISPQRVEGILTFE
ncbi:MAG: long-chain fatty acid--CoA ligase, partial [Alphaproteobacteria bacterium]|nr:long-chain fatty acid--CoA ligase [Alphaproteobacteria bacterium]